VNLSEHECTANQEDAHGMLLAQMLQLLTKFCKIIFNVLCVHLLNLIFSVLLCHRQHAGHNTLFTMVIEVRFLNFFNH
jgi:hypothetical protein